MKMMKTMKTMKMTEMAESDIKDCVLNKLSYAFFYIIL